MFLEYILELHITADRKIEEYPNFCNQDIMEESTQMSAIARSSRSISLCHDFVTAENRSITKAGTAGRITRTEIG